MIIKMLGDHRGITENGLVKVYEKGRNYDMPDSQARYFIRNDWAISLEGKAADYAAIAISQIKEHLNNVRVPTNPATREIMGERL